MDAELAALAASASTALVAAMARDGWDATRWAIAALWRHWRPGTEQVVAADLDDSRARLLAAGGDRRVQADLACVWQARLGDLLAYQPQLAEVLRAELRLAPAAPAGDTFTHHGRGHIITIKDGVHGGLTLS